MGSGQAASCTHLHLKGDREHLSGGIAPLKGQDSIKTGSRRLCNLPPILAEKIREITENIKIAD